MVISEKQVSSFLIFLVFSVVLGYTGTLPIRIPIIIAALLWMVIRNFRSFKIYQFNKWHILWAVSFPALVIISALWAQFPEGVVEVQNNVLKAVAVNILAAEYVITYRVKPEELAKLLIPVVFIFAINLLLNFSIGSEGRISASMNANGFAAIACGMLLYILYGVKNASSGPQKILYIFMSLFLTICVLLSGSKKGVISLAVIILFVFFFEKYSKNIFKRLLGLAAGILIVAIMLFLCMKVSFLYNTIGRRLEYFMQFLFYADTSDLSTVGRYNMIRTALEMFKSSPLYGYGMNNFKYLTRFGTYSHNGYLEMLTGAGIIGFFVYFVVYIKGLINSAALWRMQTEGAMIPLAYLCSYFINAFLTVSYFSQATGIYLGLSIGLIQTMINQKRMPGNNIGENVETGCVAGIINGG